MDLTLNKFLFGAVLHGTYNRLHMEGDKHWQNKERRTHFTHWAPGLETPTFCIR